MRKNKGPNTKPWETPTFAYFLLKDGPFIRQLFGVYYEEVQEVTQLHLEDYHFLHYFLIYTKDLYVRCLW